MNKSSQFSKTEDKQSIKIELDTLKSKHKYTIEKPVPVKEQARQFKSKQKQASVCFCIYMEVKNEKIIYGITVGMRQYFNRFRL